MYSSRINVVFSILTCFGTVLQLSGLVSPGWNIYVSCDWSINRKICYKYSYGLWYFIKCSDDNDCSTYTFDTFTHGSAQVHGDEVVATLSVGFSLFAAILTLIMTCRPRTDVHATLASTLAIFISGSLIWTIIGGYSASIVELKQEDGLETYFPYSLFLSAIGSSIMLAIGLLHVIKISKALSRRELPLLQEQP